jgi:putative ABC transport system ATP-binding protein
MSTSRQRPSLIRLRDVVRVHASPAGECRALDGVTLELPRGAFVAVVGRSGSGKSTLVNLIAGLDRSTAGEIHVDDVPVHALGEEALAAWRGRSVGVVFQFFQLLPTLSVVENVMLPMDFRGVLPLAEMRARALELLERVGLADQAAKLPTALSGGQQQRAAIARALANDPPLLVADEPTGNLDSHTAEEVLDLLAAQARAGTSILMVTHERELSGRVDRVLTLADGRLVGETLRSRS